jgi:hypothetical protein
MSLIGLIQIKISRLSKQKDQNHYSQKDRQLEQIQNWLHLDYISLITKRRILKRGIGVKKEEDWRQIFGTTAVTTDFLGITSHQIHNTRVEAPLILLEKRDTLERRKPDQLIN